MNDLPFLSRWSRRKLARDEGEDLTSSPQRPLPEPESITLNPAPAALESATPDASPTSPLPDVATLTPESDFTQFMKPDVAPNLRSQALKALFRDPHFNTMDMLDVYVDDYTQFEPMPQGMLQSLKAFQFVEEQHAKLLAERARAQADGDAEASEVRALDPPDREPAPISPDPHDNPPEPPAADATLPQHPHVLMRLDDNGNRFAMGRYPTRGAAESVRRYYESLGHKQTYYVESKPHR